MAPYDVYSDFDIHKHKQTFRDYLEVIIDADGHIMYAVPSHQEKLIAMVMEHQGWTRQQLMPKALLLCVFGVAAPHGGCRFRLVWLLSRPCSKLKAYCGLVQPA